MVNSNVNRNNSANNRSFGNKLGTASNKLRETANNTATRIKDTSRKVANNVSTEYKKTKNQMANALDKSNTVASIKSGYESAATMTKSFAEKNSTMAKIVFIIFVLIIFGLLFRLGVYILTLFFTPNPSPIVVKGMRATNTLKEYNVNPSSVDPKPILRSINEDQGMEFTWSTWIWIDSVDSTDNLPKKIFSKGTAMSETQNSLLNFDSSGNAVNNFLMNSPGLYIYDPNTQTSNTNVLSVVLSFFDEDNTLQSGIAPYDVIPIYNVPLQKWVNVVIRVQSKTVDIYLNGVLTKRKNYKRVVKQNYGNIFVGSQKSGMNGYISSLRYFNYAAGNNQIQDIIALGPNLKMEGEGMQDTKPPYLAMRWYLDNPVSQLRAGTA